MNNIKTFEDLRDDLCEEKQCLQEYLADEYVEMEEESRLIIVGQIRALSSILEQLRGIIKWGDVE